jgi:hypothetical protein
MALGPARCTATPTMTRAMPVRSQMVGTWPKTISPAVVAVAGSLIRPAAGRRPNPDACSRPARTEEFGFSPRR